jgi:predicted outer membrane repeat protein
MNDNTANYGAGIYIPSGTLVINGLSASGNIATMGNGGVINASCKDGARVTVTVNNATFTGNKATYDNADCYGGAISVNGGATLTINNSVFQNNQAVKGGAIALVNGTLTINGITASGNVATGYTDGTAKKGGNGGAIYIGTGTFTLNKGTTIAENTFTENVAQSGGGAIYCFETNTDIIIEQITLTNNEATGNYGGGLYVRGKATTGDNTISVDIGTVTATGNYGSNGGAIYLYKLEKAEIDSIVANNNSSTNGGAIYIAGGAIVDIGELSGSGNSASTNGGFAYIGTSTTTIHSGTVGENDDKNGRELYFSANVNINTENFTYPEGGINDATKIVAITSNEEQ